MDVAAVVTERLKKNGESLKGFAIKMDMSYSTFHKKITNNTFTAEELLKMCSLLNLSLEDFKKIDDDELIDLKKYPEKTRPDVDELTYLKYKNAGIFAEEELTNGVRIYIPYGIADFLNSNGLVLRMLKTNIEENRENSKQYDEMSAVLDIMEKEMDLLKAMYKAIKG